MGFDKPIDKITFDDVKNLVDSGQIEAETLEFKAEFPKADEGGKSDIAKDLTAFANAQGGDIIYGVKENRSGEGDKGKGYEICGVEKNQIDGFLQRLGHIAKDRCSPPLKSYEISPPIDIPGSPDRKLLVVRVWLSLAGPHSSERTLPVYVRGINSNDPINISQLREIMDFQTTLADRAAAWRAARIEKLNRGWFPRGIGMSYIDYSAGERCGNWTPGKPLFVAHLMPLHGFRREPLINIPAVARDGVRFPVLFCNSQYDILPVRDGILYYFRYIRSPFFSREQITGSQDRQSDFPTLSYTMLFRNGSVEIASANILGMRNPQFLRTDLFGTGAPGPFSVCQNCLAKLDDLKVAPPLLVGFCLSGVKDFWLSIGNKPIAEAPIISPDYWMDGYNSDLPGFFNNFLDIVANAAGHPYFPRPPATS